MAVGDVGKVVGAAVATAAVGSFTMQEVELAGTSFTPIEGGTSFEWTSQRAPLNAGVGGARAVPVQPWTLSGKQRSARTDYAGAKTPSEQVLGPNKEPFTLNGRWDDRYNFPGYAVKEMRRFEKMAERGNLVRIQFQAQAFVCLITDWQFEYIRDWYIRYSFTVSVHDRPADFTLSDRSPKTTKSSTEAFDDLDAQVALLEVNDGERGETFQGGAANDTSRARAKDITAAQEALGRSVDQREVSVDVGGVSPFRRLATQFRTVGTQSFGNVTDSASDRSDANLSLNTAIEVIRFEDQMRTKRFISRTIMKIAAEAADDMDERDDPSAERLYRPWAGESLYNISRRFYSTPFAWRLIAHRNALTDTILDGTELLIIPERGAG